MFRRKFDSVIVSVKILACSEWERLTLETEGSDSGSVTGRGCVLQDRVLKDVVRESPITYWFCLGWESVEPFVPLCLSRK